MTILNLTIRFLNITAVSISYVDDLKSECSSFSMMFETFYKIFLMNANYLKNISLFAGNISKICHHFVKLVVMVIG